MRFHGQDGMFAACAAICVLFIASAAAMAQDSVAIGSIVAAPGQASVVVPITAATSTKITGLRADIEFAPGLCDQITNQRVREAGRTTVPDPRVVDPTEGARCPEQPLVSIVLVDLVLRASTGEAAIPAGSGPIAEWVFDVNSDAAPGAYDLALQVVEARNGPQTVALTSMPGKLIIAAACRGDCNSDGMVTINELITGVNIALGNTAIEQCPSFDSDGDGNVAINELIAAVNNALNGCGPALRSAAK
jgi:hypothetical protein